MYVTEDLMLEYFVEQNRVLNKEDIFQRFYLDNQENVLQIACKLETAGLLEDTGYRLWQLSEKGKHYQKEKLEAKERERLLAESVLRTNRMQRWSFWASLITASAAVVVSLISLLKEHPTIVNPSIVLKDTILKSVHQDTLQLQIQLNPPSKIGK